MVSLDGKNLCGSRQPLKGKKALNIVSAWAKEASVVLGQVRCEEKSNEITAIPELLNILDLAGCIVTIDAIGCQKEIVKQIALKEADYVMRIERKSRKSAQRDQGLFRLGGAHRVQRNRL